MRNGVIAGTVLSWLVAGCSSTPHVAGGSDDAGTRKVSPPPDAATDGSVITLDMDAFTVPAGGESYKCQNFANPFDADVDIDRFESHMPVGSHHMIVFFMDGSQDAGLVGLTRGTLEDCSGSEFHANVFGAQTPDGIIDLPSGVGVAIPKTTWLRYQLHFVNTGTEDAVAKVTTNFHVAAPGTITDHAGQLVFSNEAISVPPGGQATATKTCSVPEDVSLLGVSAHMHRHGVDFVATSAGKQLYETRSWSEPVPTRFSPPLLLPANQGVTFTCSYSNDTNQTVTFGQSALTDEMCIFAGIYYPVADVASPNVLCF